MGGRHGGLETEKTCKRRPFWSRWLSSSRNYCLIVIKQPHLCSFETFQNTLGGNYFSTGFHDSRCVFVSAIPRAALRLPHAGVAVFLHLHGAPVRPPLHHLPVTRRRGRGPGEDLAEGDLSQENLLRVQRELWQQHEFLPCAETLVQKADEGQHTLVI